MAASFLREAGVLGPYVVRCVSSKALLGGSRRCLCHTQLLRHRHHVLQIVRTAATATNKELKLEDASKSAAVTTKLQSEVNLPTNADLYRERYIPITRRSIIRFLVEEENFLNEQEKKEFEDFALALDSAIVNKYHGILQDLKLLFDPINPDKDTVQSRKFTRREKLDNEFWLLQRLEDIMEKANFHELEKSQVYKSLAEHDSAEGVRVSVNPDRYDVLRFWVLGLERPEPELSLLHRLWNRVTKKPAKPLVEYYKRVVVAIRLKKDAKLILKAFKEIPVNNLEMLLPDGTLHMSRFDKGIITASVALASAGVLVKLVTILADLHLDWMLLVTFVTGGIGIKAWSSYKNRRNLYLVGVSRTLYFKNLSNNLALLASLVDRAEDESFKEALISYTFLLTSRDPHLAGKAGKQQLQAEFGGLTDFAMEARVEKWIEEKTGVAVQFDSTESVLLLKKFGILSEANDKLHVLPLKAALNCLPITPQSLIARSTEADMTEGYDRDEYLETEHEYKEEDERNKRYGWF